MIRNFLKLAIQNRRDLWFQQDGVTLHTAKESMQLLRQYFENKIISHFGDVNWPLHSPDLTSPDFFLWGYLKERVFINKPRTLEVLKENIRQEIREIQPPILEAVMENLIERAQLYGEENEHHLKDVIFHK